MHQFPISIPISIPIAIPRPSPTWNARTPLRVARVAAVAGVLAVASGMATIAGCASSEAVQVSLPVETDAEGLEPATNDLGWTVTLTRFRAAIEDVQLTTAGEMHARGARPRPSPSPTPAIDRWLRSLRRLAVADAHAHPGHYAGGAVIGELSGAFVIDLVRGEPARPLGDARLITGQYKGGNFTFRRAAASDGLAAGDPLLGHTAHLEGRAEKAGRSITFRAILDLDPGTQVVGLPFPVLITETTRLRIALRPLTIDPYERDTLFQQLDFGALDDDGDGRVEIAPGATAHNVLRRSLQVHDQYILVTR